MLTTVHGRGGCEGGGGLEGAIPTLFCICAAHLHLEYKRYIFVRPF